MTLVLSIIGWILFGLAILIGLALDLVGLFGNWIILGAVGTAAALSGFDHFGWWTLGILLVLAVLGEILETAASGLGAAKFGGNKGSIVASLVGCLAGAVLGTPIFPIVGTLIGACLGAFLGAFLYEYLKREQELGDAMRVGAGAALGKVAGLFLKTFVGVAMLIVSALTF